MTLNEEVAVVFLSLWLHASLELASEERVSLVKVRSGEEGWSTHLTVAHILNTRGKIVLITLILLHHVSSDC